MTTESTVYCTLVGLHCADVCAYDCACREAWEQGYMYMYLRLILIASFPMVLRYRVLL